MNRVIVFVGLMLAWSAGVCADGPAASPITHSRHFPNQTWEKVPLNLHFGKRRADVTEEEIAFIAAQSKLICLEKGHGRDVLGTTEAGIAATARRIHAINPDARVLFYFNAFINWPGYAAHDTYKDEWTLRDSNGEVVCHSSGTPRPDPSNPEFRQWWSDVVTRQHEEVPLSGVFIDALAQALSPQLARAVGKQKAAEVVDGLEQMIALTKEKLGPDRIVLVNGLRGKLYREILSWEGVDGVMIEHFGAFRTTSPEMMKEDLDSLHLAAEKGKFVVLKGWPGFNWLDKEMMKKPQAELLELARAKIDFPLACFLIAAEPDSHFCYSWGYTSDHGMFESYPELNKKLGPPKDDAKWNGYTATREYQHARVHVDLETSKATIDWLP